MQLHTVKKVQWAQHHAENSSQKHDDDASGWWSDDSSGSWRNVIFLHEFFARSGDQTTSRDSWFTVHELLTRRWYGKAFRYYQSVLPLPLTRSWRRSRALWCRNSYSHLKTLPFHTREWSLKQGMSPILLLIKIETSLAHTTPRKKIVNALHNLCKCFL